MQPPTVPFPVAPVQNALRALLDAKVDQLRRAGVCEFKWIPEEEPDDLDLAEIELDEEDDAPPDAPAPREAVRGHPAAVVRGHWRHADLDEKQRAVERVEALRVEFPRLALTDIIARVARETDRSSAAVRRWRQDALGLGRGPVRHASTRERAEAVKQVEGLLRADPAMVKEAALRQVADAIGRNANTVGKWYRRHERGEDV